MHASNQIAVFAIPAKIWLNSEEQVVAEDMKDVYGKCTYLTRHFKFPDLSDVMRLQQ